MFRKQRKTFSGLNIQLIFIKYLGVTKVADTETLWLFISANKTSLIDQLKNKKNVENNCSLSCAFPCYPWKWSAGESSG